MSTPSFFRRLLSNDHRNVERINYGNHEFDSMANAQRKDVLKEVINVMTTLHSHYQVAIVTALPKESAAVEAMLEDAEDYFVPGDPNPYVSGVIKDANGKVKHHVIVTTCPKPGNNAAATTSTNLLRSFPSVKDVLMVGIAGGVPFPERPDDHVRLGDIVVSRGRGIIQYDMVKYSSGGSELRDVTAPPSARMTQIVNVLERKRIAGAYPWESYFRRGSHLERSARPDASTDVLYDSANKALTIEHPLCSDRHAGQPKVHLGVIGSGNVLLKDAEIRDQLRAALNLRAIEMEGSGVADGTWNLDAGYLVIRGVCDYCDFSKGDLWQGYAALAAAAYARCVLDMLPATC